MTAATNVVRMKVVRIVLLRAAFALPRLPET